MNSTLLDQEEPPGDSDVCLSRKALLTLVARANAIIIELNRLVELIPKPFKPIKEGERPTVFQSKKFGIRQDIYDFLIFDFTYFTNSEHYEAIIEAENELKKADEELCIESTDILTRFYMTFQSIVRYATDLNIFIENLEKDGYIGESLELILHNNHELQLLSEAYSLLGYMLITVDNNFEGALRERLIVSYYRYSAHRSSQSSNIEGACNLLKSTNFRTVSQQLCRKSSPVELYRPENYPESFFARLAVDKNIVSALIAKLQTTDLYERTVHVFPDPKHRSAALCKQASLLYILLYFCPEILETQRYRMREIIDKYFSDNWVISLHMGEVTNLIEAWEPYRAARECLHQLMGPETVRSMCDDYGNRYKRSCKNLQDALKDSWLGSDTVLQNHFNLLNTIRESNVILRWLMLHGHFQAHCQIRQSRSFYSYVSKILPSESETYTFLQNIAELERQFSTIYRLLINDKPREVRSGYESALEYISEIISIFEDDKPIRWSRPGSNIELLNRLNSIKSNLDSVDLNKSDSRNLTVRSINELKSTMQNYIDGRNLQIVQLFECCRDSLVNVLKFIDLSPESSATVHIASDFGYACQMIDALKGPMQEIIRDDPSKVSGLEPAFAKLSASFEAHLFRIKQAEAKEDLASVSQYYSKKLFTYISDVLQVIPATIMDLLSNIASIQSSHAMAEPPSKIPLDHLKDYALPELRYQMLELTHRVSHYAEGMSMMQNGSIGLVEIDPKLLLETGIRRELYERMSGCAQDIWQHSPKNLLSNDNNQLSQYAEDLQNKLTQLKLAFGAFKKSFEYIQDYLGINGLRMWQEELNHVILTSLAEATDYLLTESYGCEVGYFSSNDCRQSVSGEQRSVNQSGTRSVVNGPDQVIQTKTSFMLRLLVELIRVTEPRATIYDEQVNSWFEQRSQHNKVVDIRIIELIAESLGVCGLNGVDQLCCTLLTIELRRLDQLLVTIATDSKSLKLTNFDKAINALRQSVARVLSSETISNQQQYLKSALAALARLGSVSEQIVDHILRTGQLQIIRHMMSCVMSSWCRHDARNLFSCLESLNESLMSTLRLALIESRQVSRQQKLAPQQAPPGSSHHTNSVKSAASSLSTASKGPHEFILKEHMSKLGFLMDDESQFLLAMSNQLDHVGLSDALSKIYTLDLQRADSSAVHNFRCQQLAIELVFLVVLSLCPRFHFSRSINGLIPKQSRSFYERRCNVDGQPLFYGLITLINHYQPFVESHSSYRPVSLGTDSTGQDLRLDKASPNADCLASEAATSDLQQQQQQPFQKLLHLMSVHVRCSLANQASSNPRGPSIRPEDLAPDVTNMALSMVELIRLSRLPAHQLLAKTCLPPLALLVQGWR